MVKSKLGRVLGGIVAFAAIFSVMSTTVLASCDYTLVLEGGGAYKKDRGGSTNQITDLKEEFGVNEDNSAKLSYNSETGWTMNGFVFKTDAPTAVSISGSTIINLSGNNTITGGDYSLGQTTGIENNGNLTIQGNGTLSVTAGASTYHTQGTSYGIFNYDGDDIYIKNGANVTVLAGSSSGVSYGIGLSEGSISIENAALTVKGGNKTDNDYGICDAKTIDIKNGGTLIAQGSTCAIELTGDGSIDIQQADGTNVYTSNNKDGIDEALTGMDKNWANTLNSDKYKYVKISVPKNKDPIVPGPVEPTPATSATPGATIAGLSGTDNNVSVELNNGAVAVSNISKDMIDEIANTKANGNAIVLDVSKVEGTSASASKVTLTKETMANIADALSSTDNNKESLVVNTKAAQVIIDAVALSAVVSQASGDNIQIVVENKAQANLNNSQQAAVDGIANTEGIEVVQTFEAYITSGEDRIFDLNGGAISIGKIDFAVPAGRDPRKYKVYAISENGELIALETWVEDGVILFSTDALSDFVLVYDLS